MEFKLMVFRAVVTVIFAYLLALSQFYLPLTVVYTLNSAGTVFVFLLNFICFKIKVSPLHIKAIVATFFGIFLTISARYVYRFFDPSYHFESEFEHY